MFEIESATSSGAAFTINYQGAQYLVTAKHVLPDGDPNPSVTVTNRFGSEQLDLALLDIQPDAADVAVAPLSTPLTADLRLDPTFEGITWSQPVFFLGYPYGLATEFPDNTPTDRIAFVKGAILSATASVNDVQMVYLDGMSNPGFSGGPVVGFNWNRGDEVGDRLQVFGVVQGYHGEALLVDQGGSPGKEQLSVRANSGIVVATQISHVTEAIDRAST
jgi:hypothetical protein